MPDGKYPDHADLSVDVIKQAFVEIFSKQIDEGYAEKRVKLHVYVTPEGAVKLVGGLLYKILRGEFEKCNQAMKES